MTTERIRWDKSAEASITAFHGDTGKGIRNIFAIVKPSAVNDKYVLTSSLPGIDHLRAFHDDPDELKRAAERWLSGFVTSLGAAFPDTRAAEMADVSLASPSPEPGREDFRTALANLIRVYALDVTAGRPAEEIARVMDEARIRAEDKTDPWRHDA